jgi:MYXO-CTERM domain-containing protein
MDSLGDGGSPSQTDSGAPAAPDSGAPVQPAGGSGDAGNAIGTQTAADTTADAGMTSGHSSGGCGCRIGGAGERWAGPWALALLAGVCFGRRRQRSREPRARLGRAPATPRANRPALPERGML